MTPLQRAGVSRWFLALMGVELAMARLQWRSTGLRRAKEKEVEKESRRARMTAKAKARENRKEKVIVKANRKVVTRRASKVVLVTDPREKGRQMANSVKIADAVDALPKTVGNSRYVQFLRAMLDNHQMLAQLSSQLCRDLKVLLQVGASRR
jgi:phage I-like protein